MKGFFVGCRFTLLFEDNLKNRNRAIKMRIHKSRVLIKKFETSGRLVTSDLSFFDGLFFIQNWLE